MSALWKFLLRLVRYSAMTLSQSIAVRISLIYHRMKSKNVWQSYERMRIMVNLVLAIGLQKRKQSFMRGYTHRARKKMMKGSGLQPRLKLVIKTVLILQ